MKLKEFRSRIGLTQSQLAGQMETTQQTVARWESGKTVLNVDQIRDLCVILGCTAEELLGWEVDPSSARTSPFAVVDNEMPYGTLFLKMAGFDREYPVSEKARESLLSQMDDLSPMDDQASSGWLTAWTLNNKLLLINPAHLLTFRLLSDEVDAMPSFKNAEVYRALEDWPNDSVGGKIRQICDELASNLGGEEAVARFVSEVGVVYSDGSEEFFRLSEETATDWYIAMMHANNIRQTSFSRIQEDGYYDATFANLGCVALVEIPMNLLFRLTAD